MPTLRQYIAIAGPQNRQLGRKNPVVKQLAAAAGVTVWQIHKLALGHTHASADVAATIERLTNGKVKARSLINRNPQKPGPKPAKRTRKTKAKKAAMGAATQGESNERSTTV
jgi:DNA-binding transcriptional regulator YdaS (Cro superfamily)